MARAGEFDRRKIIDEVCQRISNGENLRAICRDGHMPNYSSVYAWLNDDPEAAQRFARAREVGETAIGAECMDIADELPPIGPDGKVDSGAVRHQALRIETRLKLLAKWNPKKWGDRIQQEVTGADGGPIQHDVTVNPGEAYERLLGGQ